jgi:hypothetical protein
MSSGSVRDHCVLSRLDELALGYLWCSTRRRNSILNKLRMK